jgi:hypothetical protein
VAPNRLREKNAETGDSGVGLLQHFVRQVVYLQQVTLLRY